MQSEYSMKSLPIILLFTISLAGCVTTQERIDAASSASDRQLCMEWMTSPSLNFSQSYREAEIKRRGIDCWQYGNVAEERERAERRLSESIERLGGRQAPGRTGSSGGLCIIQRSFISGMNQVCIYDCQGSAYSTNTRAGTMCPPSIRQ